MIGSHQSRCSLPFLICSSVQHAMVEEAFLHRAKNDARLKGRLCPSALLPIVDVYRHDGDVRFVPTTAIASQRKGRTKAAS